MTSKFPALSVRTISVPGFRYTARTLIRLCLAIGALGLIGGCSTPQSSDSAPSRTLDPDSIEDAVPRVEPKSKSGNPASYVVHGKRYYVMDSSANFVERGIASWYGQKFHGRRTSSGETYDMYAMTSAHKSLPLPTYVQVTNLENGRTAVVKVNDRGPFHGNRVIDLSYAAATKLGIVQKGTGLVEVRAIDPSTGSVATAAVAGGSASSSAASSRLTLSLQAGAFGVPENASRLKSRLDSELQKPVRIESAVVRGQTLHRVRIGPLASVAEVDEYSERLTSMGLEQPQVIVE